MLTLSKNKKNGRMKGVFINEATVVSITDFSGKPTFNDDPDSVKDLAVEVEFDIGQQWNKIVLIKGDLKRENHKVVDWGGAFVVKDFFIKTGCFKGMTKEEIDSRLKLLEKGEMPADFLSKPLNRKIYILSYVRGMSHDLKPKYSTWNIVDSDPEQLLNLFKNSVAKGYPSNFNPDLLDEKESSDNSNLVTEDDDLPF